MFNDVEKLMLKNGIICPECNVKGLKDFGYSTTIAASDNFEDEDHHYHEHDGNQAEGFCICPNDHKFSVRLFNSCWCGWTQSPENPFGIKTTIRKNPSHGVLGTHTSITQDDIGGIILQPRTFYRNY